MTHQEPSTSAQADEMANFPLQGPGMQQANVSPRSLLSPPTSPVLSLFAWEEHYQGSTPLQQQHYEQLAMKQGLLYSTQMSDLPTTAAPAATSLLQVDVNTLTPVQPLALKVIDTSLDADQCEAVARALATPDVCLIQGGPGSGKSRLAAEIVRQAGNRGQRVLLAAPSSTAIDAVLEYLLGDPALCMLRALSPDENGATLAPALSRLTFPGWQDHYREVLERARTLHDACAARHQQAEIRLAACKECFELARQLPAEQERHQQLQQTLASFQTTVENEAATVSMVSTSPFQLALATLDRDHASAHADLQVRLASHRCDADKASRQLLDLKNNLDQLRPQAEARLATRWWTPAFWRGLGQGDLLPRFTSLQQQQISLTQRLEQLQLEITQLDNEISVCLSQYQDERQRQVEAEATRRYQEYADRCSAGERHLQALQQRWHHLESLVGNLPMPPTDVLAIQAEHDKAASECAVAEQTLVQAREWRESLEQTWECFSHTLSRSINLLAASLPALQAAPPIPELGRVSALDSPFDLLLIDDADQLTEAEFQFLAPRAHRHVLIGQHPSAIEEIGRHERPRQAHRLNHLKPGFFARLWQRLHPDPRTLPYRWLHRDGRLSCRLHPVAPEQERWVQVELVADRPDIELRILSAPRLAPQLVEVVFPPSMTIHQAKEYLYHELEELTVQSRSSFLRWQEHPERVELRLTSGEIEDALPVTLEPGVRELVTLAGAEDSEPTDGPSPWQTCGLEFDCNRGWDRARAEAWIAKRLRLRNLGRSVVLLGLRRMQPALAAWLAQGFQMGSLLPGEALVRLEPAVDFVAVPGFAAQDSPLHQETGSRRHAGGTATVAARPRTARGAGLEMELEDSRRIDLIPGELRPLLPAQGLVNYLEAQAVVAAVEKLLADPTMLLESRRWLENQRLAGRHPFVALVALSPAQVELLLCLVRRLPQFASCSGLIEVGVPSSFQQRQCHTALVSLTRSHTHRAVSYGNGPDDLLLALTRATQRLILFGDPGTLLRRSQWSGPLDHLEETQAARERHLISQLLTELQHRDGRSSRLLRVHQGGSL